MAPMGLSLWKLKDEINGCHRPPQHPDTQNGVFFPKMVFFFKKKKPFFHVVFVFFTIMMFFDNTMTSNAFLQVF